MNSGWMRFNKYIYKYWKLEAIVIILGLITVPLGLLNPYLTKLVIDKAYANKDIKLFLILAIIGGSIFVFNGLIRSLNSYLSQLIIRKVNFDMTRDIFRHLQSLSMSFFNDESTGEHIFKISSDVGAVSGFVCNTIPQIIVLVPRLLFILVIVFYLNWRLALLAAVLVPITYVRTFIFAKWLREMMWSIIQKTQKIFIGLYDVFSHIHLIKAFGKEDYEIKRFEQSLLKTMDVEIENAKLLSISDFFSSIIDKLIGGIIALYGGYQLIKGTMTLGTLTAIMIYLTQFIELTKSIGVIYEASTVNSVSRKRLAEILDIKPKIKNKADAIDYQILQGKIEFKDVYFGYKEDNTILKGISFLIPPRSKIALVGQSGCGKTTLLSLILRLYEPTAGTILIDDLEIRDMKIESLKAQIGIALQEPFLLNDSIKNNILYAKEDASLEEVVEAARKACAHDFIIGFAKGYDTQTGENACKISEGQKQRIAIARANIRRPKILILDEALASVDAQTEQAIIDNLKKEFYESTIIVVSHRLSAAQKMDLVYFFENPTSIEIGTHTQLLERNQRYRELFATQNV